jgi:hypothetical protein
MAPAMFKISQNTARCFSLGEILLMIALNQVEVKKSSTCRMTWQSAEEETEHRREELRCQ